MCTHIVHTQSNHTDTDMPARNPVPDLISLSIRSAKQLVRREAARVALVAVTAFVYDELEADDYEERNRGLAWEREVYLSDQVELFKQFLLSHVPRNLLERVLEEAVLAGIKAAIGAKKREWTPTTNMTKFTRQMYAIVKFSNILVLSQRSSLDLSAIPKMIRTKLYGCLSAFSGLVRVNLGSGSGGWVTEAYATCFSTGIAAMNKLAVFSLKYDCTDELIKSLADSCGNTLKILDIERSAQVTDSSVESILRCKKLGEVNLFKTDLSDEALAKVLLGLENLVHLQRGDFLCDVVEHLNTMPDMPKTRTLNVVDFWASEDYFFHTSKQMETVADRCPRVSTMLFMFQSSWCHMMVLARFQHLMQLDLWGGKFYTDDVCRLLETIGNGLRKLSLVHVEEIDARAISWMTLTCSNLETLGLHNCEFAEEGEDGGVRRDPDPAFAGADRRAVAEEARQVEGMAVHMLELKTVSLVSNCTAKQTAFLLKQCLNVREIFLGTQTEISDSVISDVLGSNSLQNLEVLTIQGCKKVTIKGVEMLLANCDNLRVLSELAYFEGVHPLEAKMLRARIREDNLRLDAGADEDGGDGHDMDFVKHALDRAGWMRPLLDNSSEWAQ